MRSAVLLYFTTACFLCSACGKTNDVVTESSGDAPAHTKAVHGGAAADTPAAAGEESAINLSKFPAGEEGAKQLLSEFLKADTDKLALTAALKPKPEDYMAVFATEEMGKKAQAYYEELWQMLGKSPIMPKPNQTELLLHAATTDELKAGTGNASEFPGGYKDVAAQFKPGLTLYRWKFVEPGQTLGMAFDGLCNIDGRWILIPKPWRIQ